MKTVSIIQVLAIVLTGWVSAAAATHKCPITAFREVKDMRGEKYTVVLCNEFMAPLADDVVVRSQDTGRVLKLEAVKLPVHAVLHTKAANGNEVVTAIEVGLPADPGKIQYK